MNDTLSNLFHPLFLMHMEPGTRSCFGLQEFLGMCKEHATSLPSP